MIDYLIQVDTNVFLWLNSQHNLFWDVVMKMASGKVIWGVFYLALIYALWKAFGWRVALAGIIGASVCVLFADQITASLMRPYFARLRPANLENPISPLVHIVDGYRAGRYGFPSSHASNTFAVATFMSMIFKRWRFTLFIFFWALLNCYSRIYLGVHYTGDILTGLIIGSLVGWIIFVLFRILCRKLNLAHDIEHGNLPINGRIGKFSFRFLPVDIPIALGLLTMLSMLICGVAIFF